MANTKLGKIMLLKNKLIAFFLHLYIADADACCWASTPAANTDALLVLGVANYATVSLTSIASVVLRSSAHDCCSFLEMGTFALYR